MIKKTINIENKIRLNKNLFSLLKFSLTKENELIKLEQILVNEKILI